MLSVTVTVIDNCEDVMIHCYASKVRTRFQKPCEWWETWKMVPKVSQQVAALVNSLCPVYRTEPLLTTHSVIREHNSFKNHLVFQ